MQINVFTAICKIAADRCQHAQGVAARVRESIIN